jgi:hypothetical protein
MTIIKNRRTWLPIDKANEVRNEVSRDDSEWAYTLEHQIDKNGEETEFACIAVHDDCNEFIGHL